MSTEQNKAVVRRFFELFNQGDITAMGEVYAPDVVDHNPAPGQGPGLEGIQQILGLFRAGLPDIVVTVDNMIAEADLVVTRQTARGTQTGAFLGVPPTGKPVTMSAQDMYRVAGGKVVEAWHIEDLLGTLQQLGAIPAPAGH
jgi:steroid delta-isomerase-like uncharacterized protein